MAQTASKECVEKCNEIMSPKNKSDQEIDEESAKSICEWYNITYSTTVCEKITTTLSCVGQCVSDAFSQKRKTFLTGMKTRYCEEIPDLIHSKCTNNILQQSMNNSMFRRPTIYRLCSKRMRRSGHKLW